MNKILLLLLFICFSVNLSAQEYATTQSGRSVLLKTDGTWEYVAATKNKNTTVNSLKSNTSKSNASSSGRSTARSTTRSKSSQYIRGPRGGCYYINGNGNKTYVDRSLCN
ncbi:MAG: hypothetical protein BGO31_12490 [Bacteroidetes bacterium 43-16]|nr:MAG: hypothetical protein BGO31_12490 [Bacteroidetes bacterium 43-16]